MSDLDGKTVRSTQTWTAREVNDPQFGNSVELVDADGRVVLTMNYNTFVESGLYEVVPE